MPQDSTLPLGIGSSGIVARTGVPVFMADAQHDPRSIFAEQDRDLGIVTYLGLPIKRGEEVLGVLTFNTTLPHRYTGTRWPTWPRSPIRPPSPSKTPGCFAKSGNGACSWRRSGRSTRR